MAFRPLKNGPKIWAFRPGPGQFEASTDVVPGEKSAVQGAQIVISHGASDLGGGGALGGVLFKPTG